MSSITDKAHNDFMKYITTKYEVLSDWFTNQYTTDPALIIERLDARLIIYNITMETKKFFKRRDWLNEALFIVPGYISPFYNEGEYGEIGFNPNQRFAIDYASIAKAANIPPTDDSSSPLLWTMMEVKLNDKWIPLILHEHAELIKFSKDHTIILDVIHSKNFTNPSMDFFDNNRGCIDG